MVWLDLATNTYRLGFGYHGIGLNVLLWLGACCCHRYTNTHVTVFIEYTSRKYLVNISY